MYYYKILVIVLLHTNISFLCILNCNMSWSATNNYGHGAIANKMYYYYYYVIHVDIIISTQEIHTTEERIWPLSSCSRARMDLTTCSRGWLADGRRWTSGWACSGCDSRGCACCRCWWRETALAWERLRRSPGGSTAWECLRYHTRHCLHDKCVLLCKWNKISVLYRCN